MDDRNYRFTSSFIAALADLGVAHAAVSPGSRNTPMSMTLAAEDRIRDWSHHDERSAGFFALGIAKASGFPALVTCTSGTAAAEIHPAIVEARYGRVPMIVVTADRPSDLWETGAAQTIDQRGIFGRSAIWSHDLDVPAPGDAPLGYPAALAARLVAEAVAGRGPVHLNLRFREPLVPANGIPAPEGSPPALEIGRAAPGSDAVAEIASILGGRRGVIVAGPQHDPAVAAATTELARAIGFPILPDPQSGIGSGAPEVTVIGSAAGMLDAGVLDVLTPEVVLRVGPITVSKTLTDWLASRPETPQIHIDEDGWRDPGASATYVVHADAASALRAITAAAPQPAPADWAAAWQTAETSAADAIRSAIAAQPFPTEPGIAALIGEALTEGSLWYVASSMPIRDVALTLGTTGRSIRVASNRGANGIDGFLSSSLGAAAVWDGPVVALAGDLSALHDLTALATAARLALPITFVIVDNGGGGIFHFLPQAAYPEVFERHFGTPHGLDLVAVAEAFGVPAQLVTTPEQITTAIALPQDGPRVLVVETDRSTNVAVHRSIIGAVREAIGG